MSLHFVTVNTGDDDPDSFHTSDKGKRKKVNLYRRLRRGTAHRGYRLWSGLLHPV